MGLAPHRPRPRRLRPREAERARALMSGEDAADASRDNVERPPAKDTPTIVRVPVVPSSSPPAGGVGPRTAASLARSVLERPPWLGTFLIPVCNRSRPGPDIPSTSSSYSSVDEGHVDGVTRLVYGDGWVTTVLVHPPPSSPSSSSSSPSSAVALSTTSKSSDGYGGVLHVSLSARDGNHGGGGGGGWGCTLTPTLPVPDDVCASSPPFSSPPPGPGDTHGRSPLAGVRGR